MNQDIKIIVVHRDDKNDGEMDFVFENLNRDKIDLKVADIDEIDVINNYSKKIEIDNHKKREIDSNVKNKTFMSEFYEYALDRYEEESKVLDGLRIDYNEENYELLIKLASYLADKGEIIIFNFKKYLLVESPLIITNKQRESLSSLMSVFDKDMLTYWDKVKIRDEDGKSKLEALKYKDCFGTLINDINVEKSR